jgi:hypothetical protein
MQFFISQLLELAYDLTYLVVLCGAIPGYAILAAFGVSLPMTLGVAAIVWPFVWGLEYLALCLWDRVVPQPWRVRQPRRAR